MQITSIDYMRIFVPWKPSYREPMARWRAMAKAAGCPVWVQHEAHCLDVTAAFTVHQAAALPNATRPADMLVFLGDGHIAKEPLQISEGEAVVPNRPGLGVELDEGMVEKYRVG